MTEPERGRGGGVGDEHAALGGRVEAIDALAELDAGHRGHRRQVDVAAHDRGDGEQVDRRLRQQTEPTPDRVADRRRHLTVDTAGLVEQPRQLECVERVALGAVVDAFRQFGAHRLRGQRFEQLTGGGERETVEAQPAATRSPGDRTERVGDVVSATDLEGADRDDHDDAAPQPGDEEPQQFERGRIAPLQVVEQDHHGRHGASTLEQRGERIEAFELARAAATGKQRRIAGEQPIEDGRCLVDRRDHRPQRLEPRPQRLRRAELVGASPHRERALAGSCRRELAGEAGLADARVALEDDELGVVRGLRVDAEHLVELSLAADEGTADVVVQADGGERRRVERGVVVEDALLEVAQRTAGLEAELVAQHPARVGEGAKRLGLPPSAVQGEREPGVQSFAQRMLGRQHLQLADHVVVASEGQVGVDARLEHGQPLLVDGRCLGQGCAVVHQLEQRRTAPQRQRVGQCATGGDGPPGCQLDVSGGCQFLETPEVDGVGRQIEAVPGVVEHEVDAVERAAQPGDVALQGSGGRRRRMVGPDRLDQRVSAHRTAACRDQRREHEAGLATADVDRIPVVVGDLERPEHSEPHRRSVPAVPPRNGRLQPARQAPIKPAVRTVRPSPNVPKGPAMTALDLAPTVPTFPSPCRSASPPTRS